MAGVVFAAKTTFINPASFTIWESINVLCIVVLGGMGSILGVIFGALALILLPEYLRAFSEYRMLLFGVILVIMMVFRPGGIISAIAANLSIRRARTNPNPIYYRGRNYGTDSGSQPPDHGFRRPAGPGHVDLDIREG